MIEETDYLGTQLYPQRERKQYVGRVSTNENQNFLREAFSSQTYYDEFCILMSQLFQQNASRSKGNTLFQKSPSNESKIHQRIGLDGKVKRSPQQQGTNYHLPTTDIKVTIKLFEEALRNKGSLQEKRQFLRSVICQEFSKTAKTHLDFKRFPTTKYQMYKNKFRTSNTDNDLSLTSLQKQFSNKTKQSKYDYILDMKLLKICFGHDDGQNQLQPGTSIYNIVFDKSSKLLFSADEQGLIKVWSKQTGLLLSSFRGHTSYIQQIYISEGNKYLVSSSPEGIRIWSLSKFECVAIFAYQNSVITSNTYYSQQTGLLIFISDSKYLYLIDENTINKANGKAVSLNTLVNKILIPKDQSSMVVQISMNINGYCLIGLDTGEIILIDKEFLGVPGEYKYIKIKEHSKKNLELSWNKSGHSFISGCTDGTCRVWDFNASCFIEGKLNSVAHLRMIRHDRKRKQKDVICNSVAWTCQNNYVLACFSEVNKPDQQQKLEGEIIVFDYRNKRVLHQVRNKLFYKLECVNIMEPHPTMEQVALFCQSNGRIVLFNIIKCQLINVFHERCFHIDYPHLFIEPIEAKFSPDGTLIAVSTEYGNITLYGSGSRSMYFHCPTQQFFTTDKELFFPDEDRIPISASTNIDINLLDKYPMCNVRNHAYDFEYFNNLENLAKNNFFAEELVAVPISSNPYKTDESWEETIEKQTLQNLSRQQALKSFYISTEASGNQQLANQQNFIMNQYKEILNSTLMQFNSISNAISKPQIKVTQARRRLRRNKHKRSNLQVDSEKSENSPRESASYIQEDNYEQEESQISYHSEESVGYANLRSRPRRRRYSDDDDDSAVENAKKPPAQRIQELDQIYDEIQERKNRRRTRQIESEENAPSSNRRNNTEPMPNQLCARCSKIYSQQVQICSSCHTVYCKDCKVMRGVEQNYGFICFNCSFLKKGSREYERNVSRKCFGETRRHDQFYMPQIDDQVYFFYPGYEEVLIKYHDTFNPEAAHIFQQFQLLAIDALEELKSAPLCRITDMEYLFPVRPRARQNYGRRQPLVQERIKQILIVVELLTEKGLTFQVFYIPGFVEFLVRKQIIDYVLNNQKQTVRKLEQNSIEMLKGQEAVQIVRIKPFQGKNILSLWKSIEVIPNQEGTRRLRRDLQKQLVSIWDISSKMNKITFNPSGLENAQKIIESLDILKASNEQLFKLFEQNVNLQEYPHYLKSVEVPMCIDTIVSRIKQDYYTSLKSVIFDLKLIPRASSSFSGAEHEVTLAAEELVNEIINVISGNDRQMNVQKSMIPIINQIMMVEEEVEPEVEQNRVESSQQIVAPANVPIRQIVPPVQSTQMISRRSSNPQPISRYQPPQVPLEQQYELQVEPQINRRSRPARNSGRNTRANPETELTRSDRQTRSRRINYREMEVEYQSQSPEATGTMATRRSSRQRH